MNLQVEYYRRHDQKIILPTTDSLCFFNEHKRSAIICLASATPKSVLTCDLCGKTSSLTIELFGPSKDSSAGMVQLSHQHVGPETDLQKVITEHNVQPVYLKNGSEIEIWLWNFYLFHSRLRRSKNWIDWVKTQEETDDQLKIYEQMTHCAIEHPRAYNVYYSMYQKVTAGRKYLLFE